MFEIIKCCNLSGLEVSTKSKMLPCLWVGSNIICWRFLAKRTLQRDEEKDVGAERLYQLMSGTLKSPVTIISYSVERDSSINRTSCKYTGELLGGMYRQQISTLGVKQSSTAIISMLSDEKASFDGTESEIAIITPPPREPLSRRYTEKVEGRISLL